MSGTNGMLPTAFNVNPPGKKERIHQAEKPIPLWTQLIEFVTLPNETILDQFAGSGGVGIASLMKNRNCILVEFLQENIKRIKNRLRNFTAFGGILEACKQ